MRIIKEGKSAEQIYNELKEQGFQVKIVKGIYCKVLFDTYQAINPIPPVVEYTEEELREMEGEL